MDQRYGAWAHLVSLFRLVVRRGRLRRPERARFPARGDPRAARRPVSARPLSRSWKGEPAAGETGVRRRQPAARAGRHHPPRAPQLALSPRGAPQLSLARSRADRLGLRGRHGLPGRDGHGPLGGDPAGKAPRGTGHDRPRGIAGHAGQQARPNASRSSRTASSRRPTATALRNARTEADLVVALDTADRPPADTGARAGRVAGLPAQPRAAADRVALHAPDAHGADRDQGAGTDPRAGSVRTRRPRLSWRSRSATRRWARVRSWSRRCVSSPGCWSKPGTTTASRRASRPTRRRSSSPAA